MNDVMFTLPGRPVANGPDEVCPEECPRGGKHEWRFHSKAFGEHRCEKCDKLCPDFTYPCGGCSCHGHVNCRCNFG